MYSGMPSERTLALEAEYRRKETLLALLTDRFDIVYETGSASEISSLEAEIDGLEEELYEIDQDYRESVAADTAKNQSVY